jgi:hypothetical protein
LVSAGIDSLLIPCQAGCSTQGEVTSQTQQWMRPGWLGWVLCNIRSSPEGSLRFTKASDSLDAQANRLLGAVSEFDKAMVVAKLKGARERKRTLTGKKVEVPERSGYVCSFGDWFRHVQRSLLKKILIIMEDGSWKSSVCLGLSLVLRYWLRRPSRFNGRTKRMWRYLLTVLMPE